MIAGCTIINPARIEVHLDKPVSEHSRDVRLVFHGNDGERSDLVIVDYDTKRADRMFKALREALSPPNDKADEPVQGPFIPDDLPYGGTDGR